jgi:hypothetical protein
MNICSGVEKGFCDPCPAGAIVDRDTTVYTLAHTTRRWHLVSNIIEFMQEPAKAALFSDSWDEVVGGEANVALGVDLRMMTCAAAACAVRRINSQMGPVIEI